MQTIRKVAVIGAGPGGLATAKYLLESHRALGTEPVEVKVIEADDAIGGTFYSRMYEDGELVSSKQLTAFSDFRLSDDSVPDFLPVTRYLQYLNDYCDHFKIRPHILLNSRVDSITCKSTLKGDKHFIEYINTQTGERGEYEADAVAICCGLHVTPNIPHIPGIENVPVRMHSSQFKARAQLGVDKTVMVLGVGETGSDMAYLAVTSSTKQVVLCHRFGFHFAPKRNLNPAILPILGGKPGPPTIPLDNARASLFDTSYVHPVLRDSPALWSFYNKYVRLILWMNTGTPGGYDQLVGEPDSELDHVSRMFFVKSNKAAAYVSKPFRGVLDTSMTQRIRRALINIEIPDTHGRQIDLAPWPERIDPDGTVVFRKNGRPEYDHVRNMGIRPDIVIFATGYRQEFPFFDKQIASGSPYSLPGEANVRNIWHRDEPTVGFIGFLRPNLGAIPPIAEMQAQLWVLNLLAPNRIPKPLHPRDEPHYCLWNPLRIHYGVDHESYVYQLACDMGSAQGFLDVLGRGLTFVNGNWKLPLVWAFSSNLNLRFRVRGPWHWEGAEAAMKGEMWNQMKKRRWIHPASDVFWLSVLPMSIFGPLSLLFWIYATIYWLVFGVEPGYGGYDCYGNEIVKEEKSAMCNPNAYGIHRQGRIV